MLVHVPARIRGNRDAIARLCMAACLSHPGALRAVPPDLLTLQMVAAAALVQGTSPGRATTSTAARLSASGSDSNRASARVVKGKLAALYEDLVGGDGYW